MGSFSPALHWLNLHAEALDHLAAMAQSLATVVGLIVAGIWTYLLFVKNRLGKPCATPAHSVTTQALDSGELLIHVGVTLKNDSVVLMKITSGEIRILPLSPLPHDVAQGLGEYRKRKRKGELELCWPEAARWAAEFDWAKEPREIEPHESDTFHVDFVVSEPIDSFEVYSFLHNESKSGRNIGWTATTIHVIELGVTNE
jgi:hypothetical protein